MFYTAKNDSYESKRPNIEPGAVLLNLRVVAQQKDGNPQISKLPIKTSVDTVVGTLRKALAKESGYPPQNLQITYNNRPMKDELKLRDHNIQERTTCQINIIVRNEPMSSDSGSRKSVKRRQEDEEADAMSIASKRTKLDKMGDDAMTFVSSAMPTSGERMAMSIVDISNTKTQQRGEIQGTRVSRDDMRNERQQGLGMKSSSVQGHRWRTRCLHVAHTLKGGKMKNEDSIFKFQSEDGSVTSVGVFDGHGLSPFAILASKIGVKISKAWFQKFQSDMINWSEEKWNKSFSQLFTKIQNFTRDQFVAMEKKKRAECNSPTAAPVIDGKGIIRHADGKAIHGGTTASIVLVLRSSNGQKIVTAHCGDSDILKITKKADEDARYKLLTTGHRALNIKEFERVRRLPDSLYHEKLVFVYFIEGVRDPSLLPKVFLDNGRINTRITSNPSHYGLYPSNIRQEPAAYAISPPNSTSDKVRLANTRALGDFYGQQYGLSHIPEVHMHDLDPSSEHILVAASDGVWDIWEYLDVMSWAIKWASVKDPHQHDPLVAKFLQQTKQRATTLFRNPLSVDDSSVGIIVVPKEM